LHLSCLMLPPPPAARQPPTVGSATADCLRGIGFLPQGQQCLVRRVAGGPAAGRDLEHGADSDCVFEAARLGFVEPRPFSVSFGQKREILVREGRS
jgi:hypothetical protein